MPGLLRDVGLPRFRVIARWALAAQIAIVMTGALVRLTESGLGCTDWPVCETSQPVPSIAFHAWVEFGNRLFSTLVLVSAVLAVVAARRLAEARADLVQLSWGLVVGVVAQIVLGAIVVLAHLDPAAVSLHFLVSMALVADAVVLVQRAGIPAPAPALPANRVKRFDPTMFLGGFLLVVLFLGTLVTGSGPHSGDPTQLGRLSFDIAQIARLHAVAVWLTAACLAGALLWDHRRGVPFAVLRWGEGLLVVAALQGMVGYVQYFNGVPAGLVAVHVLGATTVWALGVRYIVESRAWLPDEPDHPNPGGNLSVQYPTRDTPGVARSAVRTPQSEQSL